MASIQDLNPLIEGKKELSKGLRMKRVSWSLDRSSGSLNNEVKKI